VSVPAQLSRNRAAFGDSILKGPLLLAALLGAFAGRPAHAQHVHASATAAPQAPRAARDASPPTHHTGMDHAAMDHAAMERGAMGHSSMGDMDMTPAAHAQPAMPGAFGRYPMARESSGTAWQPDASTHEGLHAMHGDWMLMAHGALDVVHDEQQGPRGADATFASGMLMGIARRPLGDGTLQLRAMFSPDPLMGARGYPLLLASGETANGVDHLVDRQHPHDFVMELSASASRNFGASASAFVYGGLPGEPAFGPPAFMHREAIMASPEAPITHHWLDSTHISMGVVTAGVVVGDAKLELSRFNAREPDQHRWNIETGALDSTAVRASWNPSRTLALQASWGMFKSPEQLEPGVDQTRLSASALYARELVPGWKLAGTLAWGRKSIDHHGERAADDAFAAEASLAHAGWTWFGRGEATDNRELLDTLDDHGRAYRVGKLSLGALRDFSLTPHVVAGVGGLLAVNFVPQALREDYGSARPLGAMVFVRLKLE
jgi:hypothetical protein